MHLSGPPTHPKTPTFPLKVLSHRSCSDAWRTSRALEKGRMCFCFLCQIVKDNKDLLKICDWHVYHQSTNIKCHKPWTFGKFKNKYSSPMDPVGVKVFWGETIYKMKETKPQADPLEKLLAWLKPWWKLPKFRHHLVSNSLKSLQKYPLEV